MKTEIEYRGFTIEVKQDEHPSAPDEWGNDERFLVYDHRDFTVKEKGFDPNEIFEHMQEKKQRLYDGYWYFPVFAYIHSGVALSLGKSGWPFNCPWDTSFKGFALVKRIKGWSWKEKSAREIAGYVVEEWNDYLSGNVYGYNIEEGDSCWGYYGDPEKSGLIDDAKASIDALILEKRQSHFDRLKKWIKCRVPLFVRQPLDEQLAN